MSGRDLFVLPNVTDEDIRGATALLGLPEHAFYGEDGNDNRQKALKAREKIDITACPGSGKTTLLAAKLAILAKKWPYRTRGICVLSHTNAARHEIETRLGNTAAGQHLLSYPHFIGTIHGFVNEFLAMPWLRSLGFPVNIIDTETCQKRRWRALPSDIRSGLKRNHHSYSVLSIKSPDLSVGNLRWGKKGQLGRDTRTYKKIQEVCRNSVQEGHFCYDEMFVWATDMMDKVPEITEVIRQRFPILFIDEAQDNSEEQSAILYRIFMKGNGAVIRQRFGDPNQAIFNFVEAKEAETDVFPNGTIVDLPNSHRFGQRIADLADPLGLNPYGLKGQGPKKPLTSGKREAKHTIFLFDSDSAKDVLKAYAELLIETFSETELEEGTFTAVGMIHRPQEKEEAHKFPHHVAHYWPNYDPELTRQDPKPQSFVQYVFAGQGKAEEVGEAYLIVEKVAEGILRLVSMVHGATPLRQRKYSHRYVINLLGENAETREDYEKLVAEFAARRNVLTKEDWDGRWRGIVRQIAETIAGSTLLKEADNFLIWQDAWDDFRPPNIRRNRDNVYRYPSDEPKVRIEVGSIHSVKGKEHTATLVFETFWYKHNLETLIPWITEGRTGWRKSDGVQQKTRLKVHYVAITRPTHLLCLAIKRSTFEISDDLEKELDGWQVLDITGR